MAENLSTDEDYIDTELNSSPQSREFEFQMSSSSAIFPADELFYKGKLLPLHLPPRRCMVRTLLRAAAGEEFEGEEDDEFYYTMPFLSGSSNAPCTNANTPFDSCNISPSESCRASCELSPEDCFFEWSSELSSSIKNDHSRKKSWSKKFKLIKHFSVLGQNKLKSSRTFLKSWFTKSAGSDDQSCVKKAQKRPKVEENLFRLQKARALYPTADNTIKNLDKERTNGHRKSFSGAIKRRNSPAKCSSLSSTNSSSIGSSSSSLNSNGFRELQLFRRSSSATEIECSIEAAIEHCKRSQNIMDSRNFSSPSRICSI